MTTALLGSYDHRFVALTVCIATAMLVVVAFVCVLSTMKRRMTAQSLQFAESSVQLQTVFDNMTEGIVVLDQGLNIIHLNHAASKLLGMDTSTLAFPQVEATFEAFLPDGSLLTPEEWPAARALRGEHLQDFEIIVRRKDTGECIVTETNTVAIKNPDGVIVQVIVSLRDISERKHMDEIHSRLAAIVESSEDAIIGKNELGIVTSWNKGAEKTFGYTAEEMIGKSVKILLPEGHEHEEDDILARIKQGEIVDHFETIRKRKDGKLINVSLTISPIRDAWGKVIGASKIARNITYKKSLERQLRQSQKMEAIGQLTGGIAHDFNNLLGVVIGNLDLLEGLTAGNEEALRRVRITQKAALRGADLTRRLLSFSSSEELRPSAVQLKHSIRNTIELAARAVGPEINITTHFDDSVPEVFVDAAGLETALLNLVVNARDAMPGGGSVNITTQLHLLEENYPPVQAKELKAGQYACVSVSDTGVGMSRETMDRAFEPFFTTKARDKGTGLGLAMVYGFVKQSGGTARIYSEPGYGTTVSFYLPLAEGSKLPARVPASASHARSGGIVLMVDDELELLDISLAYLAEMGYTALQASDGASALKMVEQYPNIDLVVTDIIMPGGMNGVELAQKIRQLRPDIKIVYSSGFPADALAERSMPLADAPLLHKPYQRAEFNAMIRGVMEGNGGNNVAS
jgi:PAS domain S-box-containing protein